MASRSAATVIHTRTPSTGRRRPTASAATLAWMALQVRNREAPCRETSNLVLARAAVVHPKPARSHDVLIRAEMERALLNGRWDVDLLGEQSGVPIADPTACIVDDAAEAEGQVIGPVIQHERAASVQAGDDPVLLEFVERPAHSAGAHTKLAGEVGFVWHREPGLPLPGRKPLG
jgi:hypothetical protein